MKGVLITVQCYWSSPDRISLLLPEHVLFLACLGARLSIAVSPSSPFSQFQPKCFHARFLLRFWPVLARLLHSLEKLLSMAATPKEACAHFRPTPSQRTCMAPPYLTATGTVVRHVEVASRYPTVARASRQWYDVMCPSVTLQAKDT